MNENLLGAEQELYLASETKHELEALAVGESSQIDEMENVPLMVEEEPKQVSRVIEIPELRNESRKVFHMSDGTEQAVFYPSAVHVFDDETQMFEEVDDTLREEEDGRHFVCGKHRFVAKFSREENNDELFSIEQGMHRVTVFSKKNMKNKNKGVKPQLRKQDSMGMKNADVLTFANVEAGTDYEYSVEGAGVKENIVVKEKAAVYRYPFILHCENVTAQLDEERKRIAFLSNETGTEVFFIPAPFMSDANGIISTAVSYEMKPTAAGNVHFTVTADSDWINAEKRAFPVVIDPQIKLSGASGMTTYSWDDGNLYTAQLHTIGTLATGTRCTSCNTGSNCGGSSSNSMKTAIELPFNNWQSGCIACSGDEVWYKFVATASRATVYTKGSLDTMGYLYDSNGSLVASNDDSNGLNFSFTVSLTYGETYYVRVKAYGSRTGTYSVIVSDSGTGSSSSCYKPNRMYINFNMPTLPRNPRIKKAELKFYQQIGVAECSTYPKLGLYQVTEAICTGNCTPCNDPDLIDFARIKVGQCEKGSLISYSFDITTLVDKINKNETYSPRLVLKMVDETVSYENYVTLYGSAYGGDYAPQLVVTYESSYGVNTSYRTHTHELGRFGQGSIDLACGNLMFESEDFAWAGNRMPVTIKHLYNSALSAYQYTANSAIKLNTANFSAMKLGYGWKLNLMQSMMYVSSLPVAFTEEETDHAGYVYIGENGDETYFKKSKKQACCTSNSQCYYLYEDVNSGEILYDNQKRTLKQGDDTYEFDTSGRLTSVTDKSGNKMEIHYSSGQIASVTDGAGRDFGFSYSNGFLTAITAPNDSVISFEYSGNLLVGITYEDGRKADIAYSSDKPQSVTLQDSSLANIYKVEYGFSGSRLTSVAEYGVKNGDFETGPSSTYAYSVAPGRTTVQTTEPKDTDETQDNVITTVYTFDDDGNIVSEYVYSEDSGNVGAKGEESGINPHSGDGGAGVVSNINNLLIGHNFENLNNWSGMNCNCGDLYISSYGYEPYAKFGKRLLRMQSYNSACTQNGVYQVTDTLPKGEYTFSAYFRVLSSFTGTEQPGAYLRVVTTDDTVLAESEHIAHKDSEYIRLIAPFALADEQSVKVQILLDGKGTVYVDAAQLENNPYVNAYNMLENGNFERGTNKWSTTAGVAYSTGTRFNMSKALTMTGNLEFQRYAYQDVTVKSYRSTRETFTLSGWAKGYGLPNHERDDITTPPQFRLRAVIHYADSYYRDYGTETYTADFSPCTEEWQFASVQFAKSKYRIIDYIRVYCDYGYNTGTVYFDDVQLVRNSLEEGLSASDFEQETEQQTAETTGAEADAEETADTQEFQERLDQYGNALTETTFTDGEFGTIYRSFAYTSDCNNAENAGNDLISETDARGNKTQYNVDGDTSRNTEVTDRCGNKTAYEYDSAGRTTKVTSKKADNTEIAHVDYAYDAFDNLTLIERGDGLKYVLAYNEFHNLASIGIDGKNEKLVSYVYKNGNGRLKEISYANGDTMKAAYNGLGQMISEKWFDKDNAVTAHYKYVYDGQGNIVRSLDFVGKKLYTYNYEDGKIVQSAESNLTVENGETITAKVLVNTVYYYYDQEGTLVKKRILPVGGTEQFVYYEKAENDSQVVKFTAGGRTVTSHSKTDSFGRKVFDELQLGTGFVSRQFHYLAGEATEKHVANNMLKSTPTTQLVSRIELSDNTTFSYTYDPEERITSVIETYPLGGETVVNTAVYTYDALGQLTSETINGATTVFEYDAYGNISRKNGIAYEYDTTWKDLLVKVGNDTISYDAQGNPTSYLGHTLTWEKGRQLKQFDSNTYTYNANGIRTSKTVNGITHEYTLDDTRILYETWNGNALVPLYDNEETVCGIIYNTVPFYFQKNLQGDTIAITDQNGNTVARYSYDAWGVCTIVQDASGCGIAAINPFRYRGYYYDAEIGMYYLQSRYYNPSVGRFVNADMSEIVTTVDGVFGHNLFTYCENNPSNDRDISGYISIKDILSQIKNFLNKAIQKIKAFIQKNVFNYDKRKRILSVKTSTMALVIDTAIAIIVRKIIYNGVKLAMNAALRITAIRTSFINTLFNFLLFDKLGKWVLWVLMKIGFAIAGKPSALGTVASGVFNSYLEKILSAKSIVLGKAYSFISCFSSVGGIIGLFFDMMDGKPDSWLRVKI